jgi:WD40 repeat protein
MTASDDGAARTWEVSPGKQPQTVSEPTGEPINDARLSSDGKLLVTTGDDGTPPLRVARGNSSMPSAGPRTQSRAQRRLQARREMG